MQLIATHAIHVTDKKMEETKYPVLTPWFDIALNSNIFLRVGLIIKNMWVFLRLPKGLEVFENPVT